MRKFDVGVIEWGVLASLNTDGPGTSLEISKRIEVDSAAVGRSIVRLLDKRYIDALEGRFKGRSRPVELSPSGIDLVKQIQYHAMMQQKRLLSPLTQDEQETLRELLKKVHESLGSLAGEQDQDS